jgi:Sigma 54 modulation/S30EA ribosomal protein C terminus
MRWPIGSAASCAGWSKRRSPNVTSPLQSGRRSRHCKPTLEAAADLLDDDLEFYLFRHLRTGEDVVVHRRDDGRLGLLFPRGSALADENDIVVPEPSRYPGPMMLDAARSEMDELDHRLLYFIDAGDGRGKVIYLRHEGDYGLVEPE